MTISFKFMVDGKETGLNEIQDPVKRESFRRWTQALTKAIGEMKCERHDRAPNIRLLSEQVDQAELRVEGCCKEFVNAVSDRLGPQEK